MRNCAVFGCNSNQNIRVGNKVIRPEYVTCFSLPFITSDPTQNILDALRFDISHSPEILGKNSDVEMA